VEFAAQGSQCSMAHAQYVQGFKNNEIYWLNQLTTKSRDNELERRIDPRPPREQVFSDDSIGNQFESLLKSIKQKHIFVSFDLDSVVSSDAPGVSCPSTIGLSATTALAICYHAGCDARVRLMDLSEFNPKIEDYRTGRLVTNMMYYFCMGVMQRQRDAKHLAQH